MQERVAELELGCKGYSRCMPIQAQSSKRKGIQKLATKVRSILVKAWDDITIGNSVREVVELLRGSLWHLRYALALGELDLTPVKDRDNRPSLWKEWLDTGMARCKSPPLVQSMLVSDACLRLAGALDRFFDKSRRHTQPLFSTPEEIMKRYQEGSATKLEESMARIIIHRDSFMHSEIPKESQKPRYKARKAEMFSNTYNVAQLFDDCLNVGVTLAEAAQKELS